MEIIYLFYRTDSWHSRNSRELVYVTDDLERGITACQTYLGMTDDQAKQVRETLQSQSNNTDNEWDVESIEPNTILI